MRVRSHLLCFSLIASLLILTSVDVSAQYSETELFASNGQTFDFFGEAVAMDANILFIGTPQSSGAVGGVHVYQIHNGVWTERPSLSPSDPTAQAFGFALTVHGDNLVVGAPHDYFYHTGPGSVFIYERSGNLWLEEEQIFASSPFNGDGFGTDVSIDGNRMMIGASGTDVTTLGSIYYFEHDGLNWVEQQIIASSNLAVGDQFGTRLALSGDWMIASAFAEDQGSVTSAGAVYLFHYDGSSWVEVSKFMLSSPSNYDNFGVSVDIEGDYAIAGAWTSGSRGSAHVFKYDGSAWATSAVLEATQIDLYEQFGSSVSLQNDYALVGARAPFWDIGEGSVYLFKRDNSDNWSEELEIEPDTGNDDMLGHSSALYGNQVVAGAPYGTGAAGATGSAFVFEVDMLNPVLISVTSSLDEIPPSGAIFPVTLKIDNTATSLTNAELWLDVLLPGGTITKQLLGNKFPDLAANSTLERSPTITIPSFWPDGDYTLQLHWVVGSDTSTATDTFTKLSESVIAGGAAAEAEGVPTQFTLLQNYPNPFNPSTMISYELPATTNVRIGVYNVNGQLVATLVDGVEQSPSRYQIVWDGTDLGGNPASSGLYFVRMSAGEFIATQKIMLTK